MNKFITECRQWYKLWSVRTMAFWALLGGVMIQAWPVVQWALNEALPHDPLWRIPFAILTAAVTFGSFLAARLLAQPKLEKPSAD